MRVDSARPAAYFSGPLLPLWQQRNNLRQTEIMKPNQSNVGNTGTGRGALWSWGGNAWHFAPLGTGKRLNRHDMKRAARRLEVSCALGARGAEALAVLSPAEMAQAREYIQARAGVLEFEAIGVLRVGDEERADIQRPAVAAVLRRVHALHAWGAAVGAIAPNESAPAPLSAAYAASARVCRAIEAVEAAERREAAGVEVARFRAARELAAEKVKADAAIKKAEADAAGCDFLPLQAARGRRDAIGRKSQAARDAGEVARPGTSRAARGGWDGAGVLARALFRRAARLGESGAKRWLARNAAGSYALPAWARDTVKRKDGTSRKWGFEGRGAGAESSGNQGDDMGAGALLLKEVSSAYREAFLALVPRVLATLQRARGKSGRVAAVFAAARRVAWSRAARQASRLLYQAKGRDGREMGREEFEGLDGAPLWDERGAVGLGEWVGGASLPVLLSSDPRALARGQSGKRPSISAGMADAVASAMVQAAREAAQAAKGGKGAGPRALGARALNSTAQAVAVAIAGGALTPEDAAGLSEGKRGGIGPAWRKRVQRFKDAAGV
jgi:hypothetical protein